MSEDSPVSGINKKLNIYVSWENLRFEVPDPNEKKQTKTILNGLHGYVKPGQLVAVIGPSGSGKSSFLNCVAGRTIDGVTGNLLFNGVKRPNNFARFTGYVVQDDLYFESLTVKETLTFAADLKLPMSMTKQEKRQRVRDVIDELDLSKCEDTQIGTIGKGISGGERRRLAIGLEIINEPSLLLLDEPTSGLDSASALMVGKILKNLANKKNITILCTIHQPRYALAVMFDKIYFLAKGNEIYFGPTVPHCLKFFKNAGYTCPEYDNPADFLLDLVNTALDKDAIVGDTQNPGMKYTGGHASGHMSGHMSGHSTAGASDSSVEGTETVQMSRIKSDTLVSEDASNATDDEMEKLTSGQHSDRTEHIIAIDTATEDSVDSRELASQNSNHSNISKDSNSNVSNNVGSSGHNNNKNFEKFEKLEAKMPDINESGIMKVPQRSRDEIIAHLVEEYEKSELRANALKFKIPEQESGDRIFRSIASEFYITPWYNQLRVVMARSFVHKMREPIALMTQVFNALMMPLIFGSMYWQLDLSQQQSLDRLSAISILIIMLSFFAFDILMLFPIEREMFNRENASGMYRPSMFYFGRTFAEFPQHIILMAIMGTLAYWMYGLQNDAKKFAIWMLLFELTGICGTSLLLVFSAFAKTLEQSNLLATFFLLLFMLFDGNWISLDKVPVYWKWIRHISFFSYGGQGAIVNEYRGLEFKCTQHEIDHNECFYQKGIDVLYVRGLDDVSITTCIWALCALIAAFRAIAFIGVLFLYRPKSATQIFKEIIGIAKA